MGQRHEFQTVFVNMQANNLCGYSYLQQEAVHAPFLNPESPMGKKDLISRDLYVNCLNSAPLELIFCVQMMGSRINLEQTMFWPKVSPHGPPDGDCTVTGVCLSEPSTRATG